MQMYFIKIALFQNISTKNQFNLVFKECIIKYIKNYIFIKIHNLLFLFFLKTKIYKFQF